MSLSHILTMKLISSINCKFDGVDRTTQNETKTQGNKIFVILFSNDSRQISKTFLRYIVIRYYIHHGSHNDLLDTMLIYLLRNKLDNHLPQIKFAESLIFINHLM